MSAHSIRRHCAIFGCDGLILARWTDAFNDEWIEVVFCDRPDLSRTQLERTQQLMNP